MKRFSVLAMTLMLVVALSTGAVAQLAENTLEITLTADPMAILSNDLENINMNIEDLSVGEPFASETGTFTVEANTPVNISVQQNYSNIDAVFPGRPLNQIFWGESANDNWIIAPNVQIPTINGETTATSRAWIGSRPANAFDIGGVIGTSEEVISFGSGVNEFELYMDVSINENYEWYDMNANETLNGTLIVTVSGQ